MIGEKKPPKIRTQCEQLSRELMSIFRASRHVGPRPDDVLRALVRGGLAERVTMKPAPLAEISKSLEFEFTGDDREIGWLAADEERKRLLKLIYKATRRLEGESVHEWFVSKFHRVTRDENTLAVLKAELERLREPLHTAHVALALREEVAAWSHKKK